MPRKKLTIEEFLRRAKEVHGDDTFDYSKFEYGGLQTKGCIGCCTHGDFWQTAGNHINGHGCPECGRIATNINQRVSQQEFEERANDIHDGFYDYFWSLLRTLRKKIWIQCPIHGFFLQSADSHLQGCGCPECANERLKNSGWGKTRWKAEGLRSKNFKAFQVYVIKCWDENEEFYKIGITFKEVKYRFNDKLKMPYSWEVVKIFEGEAEDMWNLESQLHDNHEHLRHKPSKEFNGDGECFSQLLDA